MIRKPLLILVLFTLLAFAGNSFAQTAPPAPTPAVNWYAGGSLGLSLQDDMNLSSSVFGFPLSVDSGYDLGYKVAGFAGRDFGTWRAEIEIAYRDNEGDGAGGFTGIPGPVSSDLTSLAYMFNGYYDCHSCFGGGSKWVPYLGAGIGWADVDFDYSQSNLVNTPIVDGDDTVFAWQVKVGMGYDITPDVTIMADYNYFATENIDIAKGPAFGVTPVADFSGRYDNHSFNLGAMYRF